MSFVSIYVNSCHSFVMSFDIVLFRKFRKVGEGGWVKYGFLGFGRQLRCLAEGKKGRGSTIFHQKGRGSTQFFKGDYVFNGQHCTFDTY
jgi:hypothetical protein